MLAALAMLILLAGMLVGCGDDGGDDTDGATGASDGTAGEVSADEGGNTTTSGKASRGDDSGEGGGNAPASLDVGGTTTYAGYRITVDSARQRPPRASGEPDQVEVALTIDNESDTPGTPSLEWSLEAGGEAWRYADYDLASIPGLSTGSGTVTFAPTADVDLTTATLVVGAATASQGRIPFADGAGETVTNEPTRIEPDAELVAGDLTVRIESVELRYDQASNHVQADAGQGFLTFTFSATDTGDSGYSFAEPTTRLETPDGLRLAPVDYDTDYIDPGASVLDMVSQFEVPTTEPGTFTFVVTRIESGTDGPTDTFEVSVPDLS